MTSANLHSDEVFLPRYHSGHWWHVFVAREIERVGFEVKYNVDPDVVLRPDIRVRDQYSDDGDIEIYNDYLKKWQAFEVKSRDLDFEDKEDIPFKTFFVDNVKAWDKKIRNKQIEGVFFVSRVTAVILFLPVKPTRRYWTVAKGVPDQGTLKDKYQVSTNYIRSFWDFIYAYAEG